MCLVNVPEDCEKFKKENKDNHKIEVWKILTIDRENGIITPFYREEVVLNDDLIARGIYDKTKPTIHGGATHVYTNYEQAKEEMDRMGIDGDFIVICYADIDDFVGCNLYYGEAAFTKIFVTDKEKNDD